MKKIFVPVLALNVLLTMALIVFSTFTYIQIQMLKLPYNLSQNAVVFSLTPTVDSPTLSPLDNKKISSIFTELKQTIGNSKIVLINENISNMGLSIYDSQKKYELPNSRTSLYDILAKSNVIVRTDSYFNQAETIITLSGKELTVSDHYDSRYFLFNENYEYIYDFFADPSLGGTFYIETQEKNLSQKIIKIFEINDFEVSFQNHSYLTFKNIIRYLTYNVLYVTTFSGFLFICFNLFLFYFCYFDNFKKRMQIHILYGASFKNLFWHYQNSLFFNISLANILGAIFYTFIFNTTKLMLPFPIFFLIMLFSVTFEIIFCAICFLVKFYSPIKTLLNIKQW